VPVIEVHISNIFAREKFAIIRVAPVAKATLAASAPRATRRDRRARSVPRQRKG
jgi:hypothetical protein